MKRIPVRLELRQFRQLLVLSTLFVVVLLSFQNCGSPVGESEELSSVAANAPFPFTSKMDRIAHMSCIGTSSSQNMYFSYKFLANGAGSGLSMRPEFVSHTGGYTPEKRAQVIKESPISSGAQLQLVLRSKDYGSAFAAGVYSSAISSAAIADPMSALVNGEYKNDFSPAMSVGYSLSNGEAEFGRNELQSGNHIMTVNFAPNQSVRPIFPSISQYEFSFSKPANITTGSTTLLSGVKETRLENSEVRNWNCDTRLRFMIVREMDRGVQTFCNPPASDPALSSLSSTDRYRLQELRKFLSPSDWGVDLANDCIIAKVSSTQDFCYGTAQYKEIRYDETSTCDISLNSCPHYFSICTR